MSDTSEALLFVNGQAVLLTSNETEDIVQKVLTNNVVSENLNNSCSTITVNSVNENNCETHINDKERQIKEQDGIQHIQIQCQDVNHALQEDREELHQSENNERGNNLPLNESKIQYDIQKKQTVGGSRIQHELQKNHPLDEPRIHNVMQKRLTFENQEVKIQRIICWPDKNGKDKHKMVNLKGKYNSNDVINEENNKAMKDMSSVVDKDNVSAGILHSLDNNASMNTQIYLKANESYSENKDLNDFNTVERDEMSNTNIYIVSTDEEFLQPNMESNNSVQKIKNNSSFNIKKRELKNCTLEEFHSKSNFIEQKSNFIESSNTANIMQHLKKELGQYTSSTVNDINHSNKAVDMPVVNSNKREALSSHSNYGNVSSIIAMMQGEDGTTQTLELSPEEAMQLGIVLPHPIGLGEGKQCNFPKENQNEIEKHYNNMKIDNVEQKSHTDSSSLDQLNINSSCSINPIQRCAQSSEIVKNPLLPEPLLIIPDLSAEGSISTIKVNESQENEKLLNVNVNNFKESKTGSLHNLASENLTLMRTNVNSGISCTYNNVENSKFRPLLSKENSSVKMKKHYLKNVTPYIQKAFQVRENEKKAKLQKIAAFSENHFEVSKGIKLLNPSIKDQTFHVTLPGSSQNAKSILQKNSFAHMNKPTTTNKFIYQKGNILEKNIFSMDKVANSVSLRNFKSLIDDTEEDYSNFKSSGQIYTDKVLTDSEMNKYQIYSINANEQLGIRKKIVSQDAPTLIKEKNAFIKNINIKENTKIDNKDEINEFLDNFSYSKCETNTQGKAVKIKVNTGTIFCGHKSCQDYSTIEDSTSLTTSIECTEIPEEILGLHYDESHEDAPPPSVTSIVYCAPGGDETPLTVHLPAGNTTKPLGSSENPIQLVQQGQTFQALQPVQEKQLEQITALLQQRRISAPPSHNHQEIYDPKTNMKIVYKVIYPSDIVGVRSDEEDECVDVEGCYTTWSNIEAEPYLGRPRGRPNNKFRKTDDLTTDTMEENSSRKTQLSISRTRSGRISRPPKHMLKDFKRGHGVVSNDEDKDFAAGSSELENGQPVPGLDDMKPQEPVILELPARKKRDLGAATRLRYTCLTCGKLYMGRIEGHYAKFPDHRRSHHSEGIVQQSYSALKVMSEVTKISIEDSSAADVNKSVLSPTPGTKASETSSEPSLPMETLTSFQAQEGSSGTTPGTFDNYLDGVTNSESQTQVDVPIRGNVRGRRGRPRGRGRGRGVRRGSTSGQSPAPQHKASNAEMLQKVLSSYSNSEILEATGKRVVDNLQLWQLLSYKATGHLQPDTLEHWQKTVNELQTLLDQAKEAILEHLTQEPQDEQPQLYSQNNHCKWEKEVLQSKSTDIIPAGATENDTCHDNAEMEIDSGTMEVRQINVEESVASALGLVSGPYKKKVPKVSQHTSSESNRDNNMLENLVAETENVCSKIAPEPALKKIKIESINTVTSATQHNSDFMSDITSTDVPDVKPTLQGTHSSNNDSIFNVKHENSLSLVVDTLGLSTNVSVSNNVISSTPTKVLSNSLLSNIDTPIPPCNISNSNNRQTYTQVNQGCTTTSHEQVSCQPQTTSQDNTTSEFSTKNTSLPTCVDIPTLDGAINTTPQSQLPTVSHQLSLEELDITAADLPRLLSEGTGMVVRTDGDTNDHCDAPLNTSGDTTDLSEMLFKLQEATAGIAQGFPNTGSSLNHLGSGNNQMMAPQSITTQFMEQQEEAANHSLKPSEGTQNGALVTSFVGALNPASLSPNHKRNNSSTVKSSEHKNPTTNSSSLPQSIQVNDRFVHSNNTAACNSTLAMSGHLANLSTSSVITSSTLSRCVDTQTQSNCNISLCISSTIGAAQSINSSNVIISGEAPSKSISSSETAMNPLSVSCSSADSANHTTTLPILSLSPINSSSVDNSLTNMNMFATPDSSSLHNFTPPVNTLSKLTSGNTNNSAEENTNANQKCTSSFPSLPSYTSESGAVSTIDSSSILKSSHNNSSKNNSSVNLNPPLLEDMPPLDACSSLNNLPTIDCSSINTS